MGPTAASMNHHLLTPPIPVLLVLMVTLVNAMHCTTEDCFAVIEVELMSSLVTGWVSVRMELSVLATVLMVSAPTINPGITDYLVACQSWMHTFVEIQELVCCVENVDLVTL